MGFEGCVRDLGCAPSLEDAPPKLVGSSTHIGISPMPFTPSEVASILVKLALVSSQLGTQEKHVSDMFPSSPKK